MCDLALKCSAWEGEWSTQQRWQMLQCLVLCHVGQMDYPENTDGREWCVLPSLAVSPSAHDTMPNPHSYSITAPSSSKGGRAGNPLCYDMVLGCVLLSTLSGFPNPYHHLYSGWWDKVFSQMPLTHVAGGWNPNAGQMRVWECACVGGRAGSMPCLSQHQLRWAALMHFICLHGGRIIPYNQKHTERDSLSCQLSLNSNSASSSGVGGSTKQQPWLLMILGPTRDLRFIRKAAVHKVIYLWPLLLLLLE